MDQLDLSLFFTTKGQATDFAARLGAVSEQIFSTTFNLEKALMDQFGMQKKDKLLELLRENNVPVNSQTNLRGFLAKLQEHVAALPMLSLTIAFEPKEQTLKAISEWIIMNFKKQMVLDLTYDVSLLAGATINYNGRHGNYSVKAKFDEIFKNILNPQPHPSQAVQSQPAVNPHPTQQTHNVTQTPSQTAVVQTSQQPVQPVPVALQPTHPAVNPAMQNVDQIHIGR